MREMPATCVERHDLPVASAFVVIIDEQLFSAKQKMQQFREGEARERLESKCVEALQRHRVVGVRECDESVGVEASGREVRELVVHIDNADAANAVLCAHVKRVESLLFTISEKHSPVAHQ